MNVSFSAVVCISSCGQTARVHVTVDIGPSEAPCTVVHFSTVVCTKQQLLQRVFASLSVSAPHGNYGSRPGRQWIAFISPGISNTIGC